MSLRDLVYFPIIFNLVSMITVGALYAFSPEHFVNQELLNTVLYLEVFIIEWSIGYIVIRKLGINGVKRLIIPKKKLRWLPSILVCVSLNLLFTIYMVLALVFGRIQPWGDLNFFQIFFFIVLTPLTAGFVEELIWRGYFVEKLLAMNKSEWKAVVYSSVSFAFIHGVILVDKLIVTFLFGIIAGLYYVKERNLPVLIVSHVILDVIAFSLSVYRPV